MNNLWINKKTIMSIVLAGSIALGAYGCDLSVKNSDEKTPQNTEIPCDINNNNDNEYFNKYNQRIDLNVLNNAGYIKYQDDNMYTLIKGANIYYKDDYYITNEELADDMIMVKMLESNGIFSKVLLPNNQTGYVSNNQLIKCANLNNGDYVTIQNNIDDVLATDAYLYISNGIYIGYLTAGQTCQAISTNGEYTLIKLPDGKQGYVLNNTLTNNHKIVNGYGYISNGVSVYKNKALTELAYSNTTDQLLNVIEINGKYASVYDNNSNELLYIRTSDLNQDIVIVDLNSQRMDCYLNCELVGSWGTRSGKDETPTHTGWFDIDWETEDFSFEKYPGSHARHWIPINEFGEGIHDLVGDDEWNYGNEAYHQYGSHGCIRVPADASEFVYDNYEPGDMVLVRKK